MRVDVLVFIAISTASFLMSACSPINSQFSCNATAHDSCMTIEQVDAMTRYADGDNPLGNPRTPQRRSLGGESYEAVNSSDAKVWLSQRSRY